MITMLAAFIFDNTIGKAVVAGLGVAALLGAWLLHHDHRVASNAKTQVTTEINQQAEKQGAKAEKARAGADTGDPVERLRKRACGNC